MRIGRCPVAVWRNVLLWGSWSYSCINWKCRETPVMNALMLVSKNLSSVHSSLYSVFITVLSAFCCSFTMFKYLPTHCLNVIMLMRKKQCDMCRYCMLVEWDHWSETVGIIVRTVGITVRTVGITVRTVGITVRTVGITVQTVGIIVRSMSQPAVVPSAWSHSASMHYILHCFGCINLQHSATPQRGTIFTLTKHDVCCKFFWSNWHNSGAPAQQQVSTTIWNLECSSDRKLFVAHRHQAGTWQGVQPSLVKLVQWD